MSKSEDFLMLEQELDIYRKLMTQAIDVILDKEVSNYPIIIAHQQELELGIPVHDRLKNQPSKWSIHASTLEEFVSKNIIYEDKLEAFTQNYKDPEEHICIFVLSELGANFIYLNRKDD